MTRRSDPQWAGAGSLRGPGWMGWMGFRMRSLRRDFLLNGAHRRTRRARRSSGRCPAGKAGWFRCFGSLPHPSRVPPRFGTKPRGFSPGSTPRPLRGGGWSPDLHADLAEPADGIRPDRVRRPGRAGAAGEGGAAVGRRRGGRGPGWMGFRVRSGVHPPSCDAPDHRFSRKSAKEAKAIPRKPSRTSRPSVEPPGRGAQALVIEAASRAWVSCSSVMPSSSRRSLHSSRTVLPVVTDSLAIWLAGS